MLVRNTWTQLIFVSSANFVRVIFRVWFILSTFPELWGHHGVWSFHAIPRASIIWCRTLAVKWGPQSEYMVLIIAYLGIICSGNTLLHISCFSHSWECLNPVGQVVYNRYLNFWTGGSSVKSIWILRKGLQASSLPPEGTFLITFLFTFWQIMHPFCNGSSNLKNLNTCVSPQKMTTKDLCPPLRWSSYILQDFPG